MYENHRKMEKIHFQHFWTLFTHTAREETIDIEMTLTNALDGKLISFQSFSQTVNILASSPLGNNIS